MLPAARSRKLEGGTHRLKAVDHECPCQVDELAGERGAQNVVRVQFCCEEYIITSVVQKFGWHQG